eukprot:6205341-Pleurochrysis_carterae.AAC.2
MVCGTRGGLVLVGATAAAQSRARRGPSLLEGLNVEHDVRYPLTYLSTYQYEYVRNIPLSPTAYLHAYLLMEVPPRARQRGSSQHVLKVASQLWRWLSATTLALGYDVGARPDYG